MPNISEQNGSVSDGFPIPLQVSEASVDRIHRKKEIINKIKYFNSKIQNSFVWCLFRFFGRKVLVWLGCILFIFFVMECVFWFWIWQMPKEQLNQFTSCLDAGVVPSFKERFIYHVACFWGSIGG